MLKNDYLAFGIWLSEVATGEDTFGAFAVGGTGYETTVGDVVTGTARYSGSAVGAHHETDGPVSYFEGEANLTAEFGAADEIGTIEGSIDDIRVNGADPEADSIRLVRTPIAATFNGTAVMGPQTGPGEASHRFNGTWSGSFFGASTAVEEDLETDAIEAIDAGARAPASVAGTFGVTRSETTGTGDDEMTTTIESFVGAFGAHKN